VQRSTVSELLSGKPKDIPEVYLQLLNARYGVNTDYIRKGNIPYFLPSTGFLRYPCYGRREDLIIEDYELYCKRLQFIKKLYSLNPDFHLFNHIKIELGSNIPIQISSDYELLVDLKKEKVTAYDEENENITKFYKLILRYLNFFKHLSGAVNEVLFPDIKVSPFYFEIQEYKHELFFQYLIRHQLYIYDLRNFYIEYGGLLRASLHLQDLPGFWESAFFDNEKISDRKSTINPWIEICKRNIKETYHVQTLQVVQDDYLFTFYKPEEKKFYTVLVLPEEYEKVNLEDITNKHYIDQLINDIILSVASDERSVHSEIIAIIIAKKIPHTLEEAFLQIGNVHFFELKQWKLVRLEK